MPRRKKNNSRGRNTSRVSLTQDHVRREEFSCLKAQTGAATLTINPAGLGSRVAALADLYAMYRVVRLRIRYHVTNGRTGDSALCFIPGVTDTAPSSYINIGETPTHLIYGRSATVPSPWLNISRSSLTSYIGKDGWLKTIAGTPDPEVEVQGNIYVNASAGSDVVLLELEGVIEFRAAVEPGATPALRREKLVLQQYQRIQSVITEANRILNKTPSPPPPPAPAVGVMSSLLGAGY